MPEYLPNVQQQIAVRPQAQVAVSASPGGVIAPISGASPAFQISQINHNLRQVILCKDKDGKVGLRVRSVDKGVFVALVTKGSPSAMGGLRFGDQILQINGDNVAGYTESQVHKIFQKASVNNIVLAVRDR
jgi:syntenin-1